MQLGSYTYPYNPQVVKRDTPRSITYQETISSGYLSDYGVVNADRTIMHTWDLMDSAFYNELFSLYTASSAAYTLVDDYSNTYSVVLMGLSYSTELEGGNQAYVNVELKMQVTAGTP
jgi:hypothetical protein